MSLEIRPTETPQRFDLFEHDERIGEIKFAPSFDEYGWTVPDQWEVEVWSLMGTGKTWKDSLDTLEEASEEARSFYTEFVAERRRVNSPGRGPAARVISVPMGGQRRK